MGSLVQIAEKLRSVSAVCVAAVLSTCVGCGTTKWTETRRTATEQLLISSSIDQAVSQLDFRALVGKTVFLDESYLKDVVDSSYLISSLRQQLLAGGAILAEKKDQAEYVLEVRSGAVGTDMHSLLVGVPQTNLPATLSAIGAPSNIPEIPFVKRTKQTAVTKILLFAYHRESGRPLWQSGQVLARSWAQDIWILGAGPFQRGDIYDRTQLAGDALEIPFVNFDRPERRVSATDEVFFSGHFSTRPDSQPGDGGPQDAKSNPSLAGGQDGAIPDAGPQGSQGGPIFPATGASPPGIPPHQTGSQPGASTPDATPAAWWQWNPSSVGPPTAPSR